MTLRAGAWVLLSLMVGVSGLGALGCSTTTEAGPTVTCGPGTTL